MSDTEQVEPVRTKDTPIEEPIGIVEVLHDGPFPYRAPDSSEAACHLRLVMAEIPLGFVANTFTEDEERTMGEFLAILETTTGRGRDNIHTPPRLHNHDGPKLMTVATLSRFRRMDRGADQFTYDTEPKSYQERPIHDEIVAATGDVIGTYTDATAEAVENLICTVHLPLPVWHAARWEVKVAPSVDLWVTFREYDTDRRALIRPVFYGLSPKAASIIRGAVPTKGRRRRAKK